MLHTDGVHLVSDDGLEELHEFAVKIGLKRGWYQKGHYDITAAWRVRKALKAGARLTGTREIAAIRRRILEESES